MNEGSQRHDDIDPQVDLNGQAPPWKIFKKQWRKFMFAILLFLNKKKYTISCLTTIYSTVITRNES